MSTIGNKNFTSFQNVQVKGSSLSDPQEPEYRFKVGGTGAKDSTLTIALLGGSQEFPYLHVGNAGLSLGTGFIRMVAGSFDTTVRLSANQEAATAVTFPHRSGKIGLSGTFLVGVESVAALYSYTTNVVVSGFRAEDAVIANISTEQGTASTRGMLVLTGVRPSNSGLALSFFNVSTSATVAGDLVLAFTTIR